jgi:hypothetical protein
MKSRISQLKTPVCNGRIKKETAQKLKLWLRFAPTLF